MRARWLFLICATAAVLPFLVSLSINVNAAEPLKIRVGWLLVPAEITPILFPVPGIAKHAGTSYVVESMRFQGSSLLTSALASGELDIAPFGYSSVALAVENAGMNDLKIIADEDRDGVAGHFTTQFMVRRDSAIKTIEDLKGKVLATNAVGSIGDMALRFMLRLRLLRKCRCPHASRFFSHHLARAFYTEGAG